MLLPEPCPFPLERATLRFSCGNCGHDLEAPVAYAGVEGPCPKCGAVVRAPEAEKSQAEPAFPKPPARGGLHLPPLNEETGLVELPGDFWDDIPTLVTVDPGSGPVQELAAPAASGPEPGTNTAPAYWTEPELPPGTGEPAAVPAASGLTIPVSVREDEVPPRILLTRDEEEAALEAVARKREFRLKFFDAALLLLFAGMLAMGGAALAFTQSKKSAAPPQLSRQVMARMEEMDQRRDQAVQDARKVLQHWLGAAKAEGLDNWCLPDGPVPALISGQSLEAVPEPLDFEFIQARRIPGTERFLTMFEVLADPPMVVPVEETPAGPRLHGLAITQQQTRRMAEFLGSQGQGEAVFYVLLRPGPAPMTAELVRNRPDLEGFIHVAVEPAFPADGSSGCLACLVPGSPAAAVFARRAHDPGLRPAVVRLAWRQHRESGNYVELSAFEPNAWSRH